MVPCTSWEVEQRPGARTKALQGGPRADRLICRVIGILYVNPYKWLNISGYLGLFHPTYI